MCTKEWAHIQTIPAILNPWVADLYALSTTTTKAGKATGSKTGFLFPVGASVLLVSLANRPPETHTAIYPMITCGVQRPELEVDH
jgi:hypothetical protein